MRIKCEYCGQYIDDAVLSCPYCGAANDRAARSSAGIPKTIEELQDFAIRHSLPLEQMRFFLGEDYKGAHAFGIYRDPQDGNIVVYKNKADGSRAIRYRGADEAYGVNELYQKMHAEILNQKKHQLAARQSSKNSRYIGDADRTKERARHRRKRKAVGSNIVAILIALFVVAYIGIRTFDFIRYEVNKNTISRGYYSYNDIYYYNYGDDWYYWDTEDEDWYISEAPADPVEDGYGEYLGRSYARDWEDGAGSFVGDFSDSDYYDDYSYSWDDSSWDDSDWDWDSGSDWDSGWTDWDSDW